MSLRLFVYGSLKRGFRHHRELRGAALECPMQTARGYALVLHGQYPALVSRGSDSVAGEVYAVTGELLADLDLFEGCPERYLRATIRLADGSEALAYLLAGRADGLPTIGTVWREERGKSPAAIRGQRTFR